jgi:hypothetical protein
MLFMVVEHFRDNDMVPVYQRLRQEGRSLPDGLEYVDSWVEASFSRCFQLMRCDDLSLTHAWIVSNHPSSGRRPQVDNVTLWVHPWPAVGGAPTNSGGN